MTRRLILSSTLAVAFAAPLGGCAFDEDLLISNLKGTVRIPAEAATRTLVREDGTTETITDPRLIGPVYIGLYPNVLPENVVEKYPHPEVGPQFSEGVPGDTYPYGGTTIGDLRFACFEFLTCKMVSGRFVDFDDIIEWYQFIEEPIVDAAGAEVQSGEFFRQTCFDILNATADEEVQITATKDRNEDGEISVADLDFVLDGDSFVADFTIWQQELFWDKNQERDDDCTPGEDCTGFQLWAFMDAPSPLSFQYSTCDPSNGFQNQEYNADFFGGRPFADVLNQPAKYISVGDYISSPSEDLVWTDPFYQPEIVLDFEVQ